MGFEVLDIEEERRQQQQISESGCIWYKRKDKRDTSLLLVTYVCKIYYSVVLAPYVGEMNCPNK